MPPSFSILINTYERPGTLARCLDALARQDGIATDAEVIVVDDGSNGAGYEGVIEDATARLSLRYERIAHGGRSKARNRAAELAGGERIIFLGDDVLAQSGWLASHKARGLGRPDLAVLGPYPLHDAKEYPPAMRRWADSVRLEQVSNPEDAGFEFFVTGNISMDRERFIALGGFDERFKLYGWEDIDLGLRFVKSGGRVVFDPGAAAVHVHPHMTRAELWRREFQSGVTAWQFWQKWGCKEAEFMRFWGESPSPGPAWRRAAGRTLLAAVEAVAPGSPLLPRIYERLVYHERHRGAAEAMREPGGNPA